MRKILSIRASVLFVVAATALTACGDDLSTDSPSTSLEEAALRRRPPRPPGTGGTAGTAGAGTGGTIGGGTGGVSATQSAVCPNNDGSCPSPDGARLFCANNNGHYSCVAPTGANICSNGQICPLGTSCGQLFHCNSEEGTCFLSCFSGGPVFVSDLPVGGPCQSVDIHSVTHLCVTAFCSANSPSICLPAVPSPPPPINNG